MPAAAALILSDSPVRLWGLDSRERITRQLRSLEIGESGSETPTGAVLLLRADYLFELRTLSSLLRQPGAVLCCSTDGRRAAALVDAKDLDAARRALEDPAAPLPDGLRLLSPGELAAFDVDLRRAEPPLLEPLCEARRAPLEDQLYGNAYKGITDLVTKWLWPRPAKHLVRWCAARDVRPNTVTAVGFVLTVLAGVLFYAGHFWLGLAAGWAMTLLDTVDGKLARVTVQSSRFGHYFDHLTDLLHPPVWYLCWGEALPHISISGEVVEKEVYTLILVGYIAGRLVEGAFHLFANCSVFSWRPFDAWFRLVTARRNPCLILLTVCLLLEESLLGLLAVAAWTVLTTVILCIRMLHAAIERLLAGRKLDSWLSEPGARQRFPRSYRTFSSTLGAYAPG